ncbi:MAG: 50S ribosomal protein L11 methyltransferase [Deltaproteobacteria bacterium]|nr:50S ribosomal protein L11 methyltransferase [Deltaproteobacteria bacterium]MBI4795010.1 50S ribosomal protein L11 methyltransferase [Deltaproteobacteria bacterium]
MLLRLPGLALKSSWRPYRGRPGERVLTIRARKAFPPSHPTTRLCLELLAETRATLSGVRVLDVGCGSGILALAGAALGAGLCVGVDLSWQAVKMSRENARDNRLSETVLFARGSTECLRGVFQVLVANLPAPVQLTRVDEFTRLAAPGATLILSGFRDTQEEDLKKLYRDAGWSIRRRLTRDEWCIELPPEKSFTWAAWLLDRQ